MKELKKDSFINIKPFMVTDLKLKGNSLLIFALIYGITVNEGAFYGSIEYMQTWCNASNRNVIDCLKDLTERGLITKRKTGNTVFYTAKTSFDISKKEDDVPIPVCNESEESSQQSEESSQQSEESSLSSVKKVHSKCEESSHNILDNKLVNNINNISEVDTSDFPEDPNEIKSKKTTRSKKPSKTELTDKYLTSLNIEIFNGSRECSQKLVKYITKLQNTSFAEKHLKTWQMEIAQFAFYEHKTFEEISKVIDFAFSGWWADKIFSAKNLIDHYGQLYQQMTYCKPNYQKQKEADFERGNMDTGKRDYTL